MLQFFFGKSAVAQSAGGTAPSVSWAVAAGALVAGAVSVGGSAPAVTWEVPATTLSSGAGSVSGTAPSMTWATGTTTISSSGASVTGTAPALSWATGTTSLSGGAVSVSGTAPSLAWQTGTTILSGEAASVSGTAPGLTWTVTAGSVAAGNTNASGTAPRLRWQTGITGTIGGTLATPATHSPSCGGLPRYPRLSSNPITITPVKKADGSTEFVVKVDPRLTQAADLLSGVPFHELMDLATRATVMPVVGTVISIQDDTVTIDVGGAAITVAKPPGMRGSTDLGGEGGSGYTIGQTIVAEAVDGGSSLGGDGLPGTGNGSGIPGVSFVDMNWDGNGGGGGSTTGHSGDVTIGGDTVVTAVSCSAGSLSVTTGTTTQKTLSFTNGLLQSVS